MVVGNLLLQGLWGSSVWGQQYGGQQCGGQECGVRSIGVSSVEISSNPWLTLTCRSGMERARPGLGGVASLRRRLRSIRAATLIWVRERIGVGIQTSCLKLCVESWGRAGQGRAQTGLT